SAAGVELSAKVSESLSQIVQKARQMDELVAEIATASREQSQGIEQVNSAVAQMDKVTQQNAAAAEESASASEELNAQAATLRELVLQLELLVRGRTEEKVGNAGYGKFSEQRNSVLRTKIRSTPKGKMVELGANTPHRLPEHDGARKREMPKLSTGEDTGVKKNSDKKIPIDDGFKDF
ncbi:MAG: methyl-accepting chemotaxis protein, partial [Chthoniobacterales bacterium]|nr:methyl-accepting chemotaxis protein [Chthoniobacterales bacterium]